MNTAKQIKDFNEANRPFYIVDHENGQYSLCLAFSFLHGDLGDYGQEAFNAYAREIGEPVQDERGFYTHGNGYEWEAAFRKAFENVFLLPFGMCSEIYGISAHTIIPYLSHRS